MYAWTGSPLSYRRVCTVRARIDVIPVRPLHASHRRAQARLCGMDTRSQVAVQVRGRVVCF